MSDFSKLFEYTVKGNAVRRTKSSSRKKLEKKVKAYGKGEIFNDPSSFGFDKIHSVKEVR